MAWLQRQPGLQRKDACPKYQHCDSPTTTTDFLSMEDPIALEETKAVTKVKTGLQVLTYQCIKRAAIQKEKVVG